MPGADHRHDIRPARADPSDRQLCWSGADFASDATQGLYTLQVALDVSFLELRHSEDADITLGVRVWYMPAQQAPREDPVSSD